MEVTYLNSLVDLLLVQLYLGPRNRFLQIATFVVVAALAFQLFGTIKDVEVELSTKVITFVYLLSQRILTFLILIIVVQIVIILIGYFVVKKKSHAYCKVTASEETLVVASDLSRTEHKWPGIHKIKQNNRFIFIFLNSQMVYAIPKRAFRSPEVATKFIIYIKHQWVKAKSKDSAANSQL
jgi:hypothetical protein